MASMEKKWLEIPLTQILRFKPYRKLLVCVYILYSHENISLDEIQMKLNTEEYYKDFKRLWCSCAKQELSEDTVFTFENWKRHVANNSKVIDYLHSKTRRI